SLVALSARSNAHFVLQVPTSIGYSDVNEGTAPCGGYDITTRSTGVTDWPITGGPVQVLSTHPEAQWEINAALLNDTSKLKPMVPMIKQGGLGSICFTSIPGLQDWVGQDAAFQIVQHAVDGALYQCAAIRFVEGPAATVPGSCKNASGVTAQFIPGTESASSSTAASSLPTKAPNASISST
ncbi:hypothetical protein GQ53DRAFT_583747, partial [Thozetella sp. PMI_491]